MPVLRTRHTDAEIAEMRERNKEMLKGISFSGEWLSRQPPVSAERKTHLEKILRAAWKECFLSTEEEAALSKELGGSVDVLNPRQPGSFCAWSGYFLPDDVRKATMLEL